MTPMTLVDGPCVGTRYMSRNSSSKGCPGALSSPLRIAPNVRKLPNFAASNRDTCPASLIPSTMVSISLPLSRNNFSNRLMSSISLHTEAILTMSAPAATHLA